MQGVLTNGLLAGPAGLMLGTYSISFIGVDVEIPDVTPAAGGRAPDYAEGERPALVHITLTLGKRDFKTTFNVTERSAKVIVSNLTMIQRAREAIGVQVNKWVVNPIKTLVKLTWRR